MCKHLACSFALIINIFVKIIQHYYYFNYLFGQNGGQKWYPTKFWLILKIQIICDIKRARYVGSMHGRLGLVYRNKLFFVHLMNWLLILLPMWNDCRVGMSRRDKKWSQSTQKKNTLKRFDLQFIFLFYLINTCKKPSTTYHGSLYTYYLVYTL